MTNAHPSSQSAWQTLAEFNLSSQLGADRLARDDVAAAVRPLNLSPADLERLKTAVAEAVLNAIEHGNRYRSDLPVTIRFRVSYMAVAVQITDQGNVPIRDPETPDLSAKVSEQGPPQGWGFFLIERMVDDIQIISNGIHHSIELFLYLESMYTTKTRGFQLYHKQI